MYIQMMYYGSKYDVNNQSHRSEYETKMFDILLVYEANEEAEERNRVVFTVISFLHDVSPDVVVNKAEKTLETSSVLL